MIASVSVVVATYRRNESLKLALESLLEQEYSNFEIVLVDDNADVEWNRYVEEIVYGLNMKNNNINLKYIKNEHNMGSAKTRNIGIDAADGEYVTFLDDDDIYLPQKIKKQVEFMVKNNADYSITDLMLYDDNDRLIEKRTREYIKSTNISELRKYHLMHHITGTDTMMYKKEYLKKIGGFDEIDSGDEFYLMHKSIIAGGKFAYLPECDVKAYVHTGETGLSSGQIKIDGENKLYEFKKQFFNEVDRRSKRYIKMRHYAVLAFAGLRLKKLGFTFINASLSFLSSPFGLLKLVIGRKI